MDTAEQRQNPVALVTGAGVGIGRGIALELAGAGYDVAVHCNRSRQRAQDVCDRIQSMGRRGAVIQADISRTEGVHSLFAEFRGLFGRLSLFVNNSGLTLTAPLPDMDEETFDRMADLNWKGSYFCVQQAGRLMAEQGAGGSIVVITSNHSRTQIAGCSVYGPVKAALNQYVRHAAMELARYGIRVNAVAPGFTDTGEPRMGEREPTYYRIPLKRWCTPGEIGQTVLFLTSPAAASITGECIVMDGGASLMSDRAEKYGL